MLDFFESGRTVRYHTHLRMSLLRQTTADHSWGVAALLVSLHPGLPSRNLLVAAIFHDSGEKWAGDLASDFKREHPALAEAHRQIEHGMAARRGIPMPELNATEIRWLHFADQLEAFLFMRMNGSPWSRERTEELLGQARVLGVEQELRNVIGGSKWPTKTMELLRKSFASLWSAMSIWKPKRRTSANR